MLEKFEIEINNLKRKINKKALAVGIFMLFTAVLIFGLEMTNNFKRQKQEAQDSYNKSLYEMVGYVKNVEAELSKVRLLNTSNLTTTTLASIWRQASNAKENLDSLPVEQTSMEKASKYLSQVSDYAYVLMKKVVKGEKINDKEYEDLKKMHDESVELANISTNIYNDLNNGRIKWDELKKLGNENLSEMNVAQNVSNIEKIGKTFQEYEGLIYDGAFSNHMLNSVPKLVENEMEVTSEKAQEYITNVFGKENIESIKYNGESNGTINLYSFEIKLFNEQVKRNIDITKKGCKMYLMISDRKVLEEKISIDEAKNKAIEFLKKIGIEDVKDTYFLKVENMAIINFAGVQDDVVMYTDLVKVKVALDDGDVCSVETQGYTFNHVKRSNLMPTITINQAKKNLNKNIDVQSEGIALIPTESKNEILTYEFKGKVDEKEFLIYVNAKTGIEEKILIIIDTPNGTLTM